MTVLVGIAHEGVVYIGADRGASDDQTILSLSRPKVNIKDGWIFAFSGSLGNGQLLEYIDFPDPNSDDIQKLIRLDIVSSLKDMLEEYGKDSEDNGVDFLIGANGKLFEFSSSDWSVAEVNETAVGSGGSIAIGSLYTSSILDISIEERMVIALNAAITFSPGCQGPYDIFSL